jgi:hypothetical protein
VHAPRMRERCVGEREAREGGDADGHGSVEARTADEFTARRRALRLWIDRSHTAAAPPRQPAGGAAESLRQIQYPLVKAEDADLGKPVEETRARPPRVIEPEERKVARGRRAAGDVVDGPGERGGSSPGPSLRVRAKSVHERQSRAPPASSRPRPIVLPGRPREPAAIWSRERTRARVPSPASPDDASASKSCWTTATPGSDTASSSAASSTSRRSLRARHTATPIVPSFYRGNALNAMDSTRPRGRRIRAAPRQAACPAALTGGRVCTMLRTGSEPSEWCAGRLHRSS